MSDRTLPSDARTPLTVLTGFLGSGKTTLLRRVLATTRERIAVLVNEVADLPIDERLLSGFDEEVLALPGGCVCCAMRADLHDALDRLRRHSPDRIVLETSGLADPAPVLGALTADARLAARLRPVGVVSVVDGERGDRLLDVEPEVQRQLEFSDRIAVTKADIAPERVALLRKRLEAEFAGRDVRVLSAAEQDVAWLCRPPFEDATAARRWLAAPSDVVAPAHAATTTRSVRSPHAVDVDALQLWLRLVAQMDGERLLRIKAVARCARTGRAFALHGAGRSVSPPLELASPPRGVPGAEVVLVARRMPERALAQALDALDHALAGSASRQAAHWTPEVPRAVPRIPLDSGGRTVRALRCGAMTTTGGDLFAAARGADYALPPELTAELQTPALVVWLDRVRANIRRALELAGGADRWRPHLKTTKIPEVWAELLRAGVRQFKCATTREAAVFADVLVREGATADLLVAYPHRDPALRRLGALAKATPGLTLSVLVEDPTLLPALPSGLGVYVDVNPGMNRTGVPLADGAAVQALAAAAGPGFRGLHCYDGHQHASDLTERRAAIFSGYEQLLRLVRQLDAAGQPPREVITAGTPAFAHALAFPGFAPGGSFVHRVSPGTIVFHDARTEVENPGLGLVPAALVLTRVVSHPTTNVATCDAGSKALAAEGGDPCAFVLGRRGLTARTPSEEHLPLACAPGRRPERGELLLLVPWHVCPTVNLAEQAVLVESETPPRVVPVAARAHELTG